MVWIFSLKLSYLAPRSEIRKPIEDGVLFGESEGGRVFLFRACALDVLSLTLWFLSQHQAHA